MRAGGIAPTGDASIVYPVPYAGSDLRSGSEDTRRRADGPLAFEVTARDAAGNEKTVSVTVVVDNTGPAKLVILTPADGATVRGVIQVRARVEDAQLQDSTLTILIDGVVPSAPALRGVIRSRGLVNGVPVEELSYALDTTRGLDREMRIDARATDKFGNTSSRTVIVTVDNLFVSQMGSVLYLGAQTAVAANISLNVLEFQPIPDMLIRMLPVSIHQVEVQVPGGNAVRARGWGGPFQGGTRLRLDFSKRALAASILAGMASGAIAPEATRVDMPLVVDGLVQGTTVVRLARVR
jgi:hypothetical protein